MQLTLLIPFFVILYCKRAWLGHLSCFVASVLSTLGIAYVCAKYNLKMGPLAEENWYLFSYLFQKPQFKVGILCLGITSAYFYMQILAYRNIFSAEERKRKFPFIDWMYRS